MLLMLLVMVAFLLRHSTKAKEQLFRGKFITPSLKELTKYDECITKTEKLHPSTDISTCLKLLVQFHNIIELSDAAISLVIQIILKYYENNIIANVAVTLLGKCHIVLTLTAIYIASKFNDIKPLSLSVLVSASKLTVTAHDIIEAERLILFSIKWIQLDQV